MDIISANNITKQFINQTALDNINISVPEQSIFGLLGPNGAGKTTLIRIINQIIAPDKGQISFLGNKLSPIHTKQIGYLPEERGLYKKMKVGEQVLYLAQLKGLSKHDALKKLKYWFEKFEMQSWWNKKAEELSKGMQQKVQFVITVIHEPVLLIFDEPFSGFDPINVNIIREEILNLRNKGATIIFSTHNMASVEELCDYIALINKSKNILTGNIKKIKDTYKANIYELELSEYNEQIKTVINNNFELLEHSAEDGLTKIKIKIPSPDSSNDLIKAIMPYATIISFKEILPGINDIFITEVSKKKYEI
jgi:ABC-2 type transport system ATP-binding protein